MRAATALLALATLTACDAPPILHDAPRPVYQYRTADGRLAFTDDPNAIPTAARDDAAEVDLSHVSLNEELGRDLEDAIAEEHARLAASDPCNEAREAASGGLVERMLDEHGTLLATSALVVLLIVTAPFIARRAPPGAWARFLLLVVPVVILLAIVVETMRQAQEELGLLRTTSELCDPEAFGRRTIAERISTVQNLEAVLARETGGPVDRGM
jgi:hypothetical protein